MNIIGGRNAVDTIRLGQTSGCDFCSVYGFEMIA